MRMRVGWIALAVGVVLGVVAAPGVARVWGWLGPEPVAEPLLGAWRSTSWTIVARADGLHEASLEADVRWHIDPQGWFVVTWSLGGPTPRPLHALAGAWERKVVVEETAAGDVARAWNLVLRLTLAGESEPTTLYGSYGPSHPAGREAAARMTLWAPTLDLAAGRLRSDAWTPHSRGGDDPKLDAQVAAGRFVFRPGDGPEPPQPTPR
jgi:hypothetical protein